MLFPSVLCGAGYLLCCLYFRIKPQSMELTLEIAGSASKLFLTDNIYERATFMAYTKSSFFQNLWVAKYVRIETIKWQATHNTINMSLKQVTCTNTGGCRMCKSTVNAFISHRDNQRRNTPHDVTRRPHSALLG